MKRLLCLFLSFFAFPAFAVTSESYVDAAVDTLQDKIPAENANTVLTNTGVAGEIGTKKIYDETQGFGTQTDALITAETFNAAVQNAIDNEYVCVEWLGEHIPGNCLLYQIRAIMPKQTPPILPTGYTQLEYIESTGTQYLDTEMRAGRFVHDIKFTSTGRELMGNNPNSGCYWGSAADGYAYELGSQRIYADTSIRRIIEYNNSVARFSTLTVGDASHQIEKSSSCTTYTYQIFHINKPTPVYYSSAQLYGFKAYDANDALVHDWIPARRNSDGKLGMYDTVTGTFFTNAGTGEFIAGPDVVSNLYLPSGN